MSRELSSEVSRILLRFFHKFFFLFLPFIHLFCFNSTLSPSVFLRYSSWANPNSLLKNASLTSARCESSVGFSRDYWFMNSTRIFVHILRLAALSLLYLPNLFIRWITANVWDPICHYNGIRHLAVYIQWIAHVNHFRTGNERSRIHLCSYLTSRHGTLLSAK